MPLVLTLVVVALALYRLVRLEIEDTILEPLRERTVFKLDPTNWLRQLAECPWCIGLWFSGAATVLIWAAPTLAFWLSLPFALSSVVGILAEKVD